MGTVAGYRGGTKRTWASDNSCSSTPDSAMESVGKSPQSMVPTPMRSPKRSLVSKQASLSPQARALLSAPDSVLSERPTSLRCCDNFEVQHRSVEMWQHHWKRLGMLDELQLQNSMAQIGPLLANMPVLLCQESLSDTVASSDSILLLGLPMAWYQVTESGRHTVQVNRLLVGVHLAIEDSEMDIHRIGACAKQLARQIQRDFINQLDTVDVDDLELEEVQLSTPTPRQTMSRMDRLNLAAKRLNTSPRQLVAVLLGRTLH